AGGVRQRLLARFLARRADPAPPAAASPWRALGEDEMRGVTAKGYAGMAFSQSRLRAAAPGGVGEADLFLHPVLGMLSADAQAKDVLYGPGGALPVWNRDGSVTLALPSWVGEIEVQNIRPGAAEGNSFGSVRINAIDLSRTTITIAPK
ncbi:hypothetical protein, partial [Janthinobacterium sp.]|uniref:hypothetical protein n=1 Tax=Janthinobacterium sp. TaxID=1871054 RepID=UPI00293D72B4